MQKMLAMLPGMGQAREAIENLDEKELGRTEAIIYSMTPAERDDVGLLNGSRRSRIAKGSGTTVTAVNSLVKRFLEAQKMMKSMAKGGVPQIPGMVPGMAAATYGGGKRGKNVPKKAKGKSGNPAKRAQQEAEALRRAGDRAAPGAAGSAFGVGAGGAPELPEVPGFLRGR
jgi:signal recognition particle subunit SRP54